MSNREVNEEVTNESGRREALFGAAGRAAGGGAASAGGAGSALKLSTAGKGEGRHYSTNFLALAFGASDLFGGIQHQFFKFIFTLITLIFVNRHLSNSLKIKITFSDSFGKGVLGVHCPIYRVSLPLPSSQISLKILTQLEKKSYIIFLIFERREFLWQ
jgi:hypothetical protein